MLAYKQKIQETAKRLLEDGTVDVFIGFKQGTVPMTHQPVVIRKAEDAETLHYDSHCSANLCNFLTGRKDKIGILANGCTSRNIALHIQENQISRDQVTIVGIPCTGMIDRRMVKAAVNGQDIREVVDAGDALIVKGLDFEETVQKADVMQTNCTSCTHRNPVIFDEKIADDVPELDIAEPYADVKAVEGMDDEARFNMFENIFSTCIRCYACRNACPLCYCPTCFVDETKPQWIGKSSDPTDTMTFHFLRAFHMAGRCTDCGACEQACPVDIPLRYLTKKLNMDAKEIYGFESGMSEDEKPLLDTYQFKDLNDFIK